MKEYIKVERKIFDEKIFKITCDKCGKIIPRKKAGDFITPGNPRYYEIITKHNNWGNDSHESIEYYQYCSSECFIPFVEEYFNKKNSGAIDMEIETRYNIDYD